MFNRLIITITFTCLLFALHTASAQVYKHKEKSVVISFFSETPVENISAISKSAGSIINFNNDTIVFKIPITSFRFKNSLMEDHFNENYLESVKYPSSVFKGKIEPAIDPHINGVYNVKVSGILEIHGVRQNRTIEGTMDVKDNMVIIHSDFNVKLTDHKIEVPKIVFTNIAEVIKITIDGTYLFFK